MRTHIRKYPSTHTHTYIYIYIIKNSWDTETCSFYCVGEKLTVTKRCCFCIYVILSLNYICPDDIRYSLLINIANCIIYIYMCVCVCVCVCVCMCVCVLSLQHVRTRVIPCTNQPPTRGDDTVSVGNVVQHYIYIYIYITLTKGLTSVTHIMQRYSDELTTLVSVKAKSK